MQDGKEKGIRTQHGRVRTGSGVRAKNHTIILNSEATGGVRARLGGGLQGGISTGRIGGLEEPATPLDPSWESPKVSSEMLVTKAHDAASVAEQHEQEDSYDEPIATQGGEYPREADTFEESENDSGAIAPTMSTPEVDILDPLGLFNDEETHVAATERDGVANEMVEENAVGDFSEPLEVEAESHVFNYESEFTPDPLPEAVRVEEEHMVAGAGARREEIAWKAITPLVGFLVSFDFDQNGSYLELRTGRLIVTSQREASGSCLVLHDQSVSPSHAVMRVASDGTVQVLDQLSESGTRVRRFDSGEELLLSGEKTTLGHGDVVSFGDRSFHVCLVMVGGAS